MNLNRLRRQIDGIDRQLLKLLNRRADLSLEIGRIKKKRGLPILDNRREELVLRTLTQTNHGPLSEASLRRTFHEIFRHSRKLQAALASGMMKRRRLT